MINRKKILIFTPGGVGGAERMSVLIGKLLPKDRFDVKYVVIGRLRNIYNILPEGYDVDCIPVRSIYAFSTLRIWWKILTEKPDVVFTSQAAYNPRVIIASRLAGRKVVVRSSGMVKRYSKCKFREVKFTYPLADKLIAQQEDMREQIINLLNVCPDKIVTIHNPIDSYDIDMLASAGSPFSQDASVNYVNVASINPNKSQDIAIKALAVVRQRLSNADLYLIGNYDENSDYYKRLIKLINRQKLGDCVHFIGYDKNPYKWVKNANCFILSSKIEGFPNALIEASYLGVPCVTTRCLKLMDDIIENSRNGYVVDVDDVEGMAQAMMKAVNIKKCEMIYKPGETEDFINVFRNV
jgi:glycosyltransferase involved in cell wall biosynthesis